MMAIHVAPTPVVAWFLDDFREEAPMPEQFDETVVADIPPAFWRDVVLVARRLGMQGHEIDLLRPLMNESGLSYKAHNPTGDAAGIFQAMPQTLRDLGFRGGWQAFTRLNDDEQLPWMERYYARYRGHLVNATAVYLATFAPAMLAHAAEPETVICARDGSGGCGLLSPGTSRLWYAQNKGLDANGDGKITVQDLTDTIARADRGPRWEAIAAHVQVAIDALDEEQPPDTLPEPVPVNALLPIDGGSDPEAA